VAVVRFQKVGLRLFVAQLAANALWTWLFFGWHRGALAAVEILVLLALIVATAAAFWRNSRLATVLLVPYVLWVSFASALTWAVWQSNPGLLQCALWPAVRPNPSIEWISTNKSEKPYRHFILV
jgi:tryptophan-rich sensory protein